MSSGILAESAIFQAALQLPVGDRQAYLDQACGGDQALRGEVESLLRAHDPAGEFLAGPAAAPTVDRTVSERPGMQIGPYKLLQQIGEGGFGVVYMAEQQQPVRRKVALKIIKPGMDTKEVIARFESERQALALMDHPNIARVLDAGATQSGRPYFVMELVKGLPITEFADKNRQTVEQRLELFTSVCQAVQHAHQKGVIHRDLKPSNVMVTLHDGRPVAKVIDFGVAKATSQQLTLKTLFTAYGQMIGTPVYMSPEQAEMSGLDIDTRSDIYSLGVLLYELLTGTTPLELGRLRAAGFVEMQRMIREEEAPRPSTRFSTMGGEATALAGNRGTDAKRLGQSLRGDLDWIVMKSLEKDRNRRYETPSAFAADIQRFLSHDAILARPPSAAYTLRKFVRRNRVAVFLTSFVAATVLAILFNNIVGNYRVRQQRDRALAAEQAAVAERDRAEAARAAEAEQRKVAKQERDAAADAQKSAVQEKNNALAAREELRHTLYAAEMNLVQAAAESRQYARVAQLLDQQRPATGQSDLRGFEWHYWQRRLQFGRLRSVEVPQLAAHGNRSGAITFSRGGARLAAVADYPSDSLPNQGFGLLAVFDATTGRELFAPLDPFPDRRDMDRPVPLLSMSSDGTRLAVALYDRFSSPENSEKHVNRISIRDGLTGHEIRSLESPGILSQIALTADGSRLAAVYYERLEFFSRQTGVNIWDTSTGELVQTLPILPGGLHRILWNPDGARLLRESYSIETTDNRQGLRQQFQIVDGASSEELWRREVSGLSLSLSPWSWSPDGKLLVVAETRGVSAKPNVQLWDSTTGMALAILDREFESPIRDSTIAFSPDGQLLAVVSAENEIYVWEVPQLPLTAGATPLRVAAPRLTLQSAGAEIRALAFSADGRELRSVAGNSIVAWDARIREDTGLGPAGMFSRSRSSSVAISADATKVVTFNGEVLSLSASDYSVWDLARDEEVCRLKTDGVYGGVEPVFSPDGRRVALVRSASTPQGEWQIVIHDSQTGLETNRIRVDKPAASNITVVGMPHFRPGGGQIAAVITPDRQAENRTPRQLMAWDEASEKPLFSVSLDNVSGRKAEYLLGYSPNGASLVVAYYYPDQRDGAVVYYDAVTGDLERSIPVPSFLHPRWIDFQGQTIGAVGPPQVDSGRPSIDVALLDLATGQERLRLRGLEGFDRFAVSPDGTRLVLGRNSLSSRAELTLYSLKSGRRLLTLNRPGRVDAVSFSPDGNRLLAAFSQSSPTTIKPIQVWDATPLDGDSAQK